MAILDSLIGAGAPQTPAPSDAATGSLEQLAELAPVKAVLDGEPPAVSVPPLPMEQQPPVVQTLANSIPQLNELGLSVYRSNDDAVGVVLFNSELLTAEEVQEADKAGSLGSLVTPLDSLLNGPPAKSQPGPAATTPPPTPAPVPANTKMQGRRLKALVEDEQPTERKLPAGGRVLNSLLNNRAA